MNITRRTFIQALGATTVAGALTPLWRPALYPPLETKLPLVDMHVHLFGVLERNGCWISPKQRAHWTHAYFLRLLHLHGQDDLDETYVQGLVQAIRSSSVRRVVLQAWDGRINARGTVDRRETTSLLVPNDYLFRIVRRFPDVFIPCASINPYRRDALDELARCADLGARMVKIHPPTMDADPSKPCLQSFYRLCQARRILVMVHTGHEHAAEIVGLHNCNPAKLELALEEGCTVIAAHAGTGQFSDEERFFEHFRALIHRYPNLYCDNSVMASLLRWRNLPQMLADAGVLDRMVHGSDYPFPSNGLVFWNRLAPRTTARLVQEKNLLERDVQIKRALGIPQTVFERGAQLLGLQPTAAPATRAIG